MESICLRGEMILVPDPWIHAYKDNPTSGGTDGNRVSEDTGLSPIDSGQLNATQNQESAAIKLALRCEAGYQTAAGEDTVVTPTGPTAAKWALAPDNAGVPGAWGNYGAALTISSVIDDINTIFWAKAKATSDEGPINDTTVDLQVDAVIAAQ